MSEKEEGAGGEQDDVSFLRTVGRIKKINNIFINNILTNILGYKTDK